MPARPCSRSWAKAQGGLAQGRGGAALRLPAAEGLELTRPRSITGREARSELPRPSSADAHAQDADRMRGEVVLDRGAGGLEATRVDADHIGLLEGVHG